MPTPRPLPGGGQVDRTSPAQDPSYGSQTKLVREDGPRKNPKIWKTPRKAVEREVLET